MSTSKRVKLTKRLYVSVDLRRRVNGYAGYWFRMRSGPWSGMWIAEATPNVYFPGQLVRQDYLTDRKATLQAGRTYVLRRYLPSGTYTASRTLVGAEGGALDEANQLQFGARALYRGRSNLLIRGGAWDGWWIDARGVLVD